MSRGEYSAEQEHYQRMGWCSCPECDVVHFNWDEFVEHADACVYGEQGVRLTDKKFTWHVS